MTKVFSARWLASKLRGSSGLPTLATIEPTTRCNCRCLYCRALISKTEMGSLQSRDMTLEDFDMVLKKLPFIRRFEFVGLGEPFLHPHLFDMIIRINRNGKKTCVSTNGTILDENTCVNIIRSGVDHLRLSIDSTDPDTFAKLRVGAELEQVKAGVRRLVNLKRRMKSKTPHLILSVVASRENQGELKNIIRLAQSLEVPVVRIRNLYAPLPEMQKKKIPDLENLKLVEELTDFAQRLQIELHTFAEECLRDLRGVFITADGYVTPCIFAYYPEKIRFGNLLKEEFMSIWNSAEYKEFRRSFSERTPRFCQLCKGLSTEEAMTPVDKTLAPALLG
jgi:radical SAM protein with 4Fe4S-binding SPASM domain